jgi:hypothetical protein
MRILDGTSYDALVIYIADNFNLETSRQTVGNFFRSVEGAEFMEKAYENLRAEYKNEPLIEKSTRVMALREQTAKLQAFLRTLPTEAEAYISYSQELRQYIKQISVEMDGINVNVTDGKSATEVALDAAMAKAKKLELVK